MNDRQASAKIQAAEERTAEIETVRTILACHRVLLRDQKRRLPSLPDGFFLSVAAYLTELRASDTVCEHIRTALTHHELPIHERRIEKAVVDLLEASKAWRNWGHIRSREEIAASWADLRQQRLDHLQRVVSSSVHRAKPRGEVVANYDSIGGGDAFHLQDMGWRHSVDVLMDRILATTQPPRGANAEEDQIHRDYETRLAQSLAYPFLAAWRLCIEIQLKETFDEVELAVPASETIQDLSKSARKTHKLGPIWRAVAGAINEVLDSLSSSLQPEQIRTLGTELKPDWVNTVIEDLEAIDPDGQQLRYRVNLDGSPNLGTIRHIEVSQIHADLQSVESYLNKIRQFASSVSSITECDRRIDDLTASGPAYRSIWL